MNEYYYLDMYGNLKFCNDDSMICSPLHSFINDGKEFCELSGFDTNHISINCFDGDFHHSQKKIASHRKLNRKLITNKNIKSSDTNEPQLIPSISSSDIYTHPHNAPSLQNLNL